MKKVRRALAGIDESLKPLGKEKYLEEYIELKKRTAKLSSRMRETEGILAELTGKDRKKIVRKAAALAVFLRKKMGRPRRSRYREVTRKIRAYSRMLRDVRS